jgi:hypothetical protein
MRSSDVEPVVDRRVRPSVGQPRPVALDPASMICGQRCATSEFSSALGRISWRSKISISRQFPTRAPGSRRPWLSGSGTGPAVRSMRLIERRVDVEVLDVEADVERHAGAAGPGRSARVVATRERERDRMTARIESLGVNRDAVAEHLEAVRPRRVRAG